jgi:transketolase
MTIVQPGNAEETRALLRWALEEAEGNVAIRLAIGPSPRRIELPAGYEPAPGRGALLREGNDAVLLAYGPVMLHEALLAAELLEGDGISLRVIDLPWLNLVDPEWLAAEVAPLEHVVVLEDHSPVGALGDTLRRALDGRTVTVAGVEGWPACGTPDEALRFHGLDGASLAGRIAAIAGARASA